MAVGCTSGSSEMGAQPFGPWTCVIVRVLPFMCAPRGMTCSARQARTGARATTRPRRIQSWANQTDHDHKSDSAMDLGPAFGPDPDPVPRLPKEHRELIPEQAHGLTKISRAGMRSGSEGGRSGLKAL